LFDLFKKHCPFISEDVKSEIYNFDKSNSIVELIHFYNIKIISFTNINFQLFDLKIYYK
jgi:hypothetical protein